MGTKCYHVNTFVEGDTTTHNTQQYTIEPIMVFIDVVDVDVDVNDKAKLYIITNIG